MTTTPITPDDEQYLLYHLAECRRDVADIRTMLAEIRAALAADGS